MKRLLLAFVLVACVTTAARAEVYDGGNLIVRGALPVGQPGRFQVATSVSEYSNITSYQSLVSHGAGAQLQGVTQITGVLADDITPLGAHPGSNVTSFTFSIANFNDHAVTIRPLARFWNADAADGRPGTYYGAVGFNFAPVTVPSFTVALYTGLPAPGQFPMPGLTFWAGLAFDDNHGTTGATLAELSGVGQGGFYPPTVGTTADKLFATNDAGSFFGINNPFGGLQVFAPIGFNASMAWEFVVDDVVPVKSTTWGGLKALYR